MQVGSTGCDGYCKSRSQTRSEMFTFSYDKHCVIYRSGDETRTIMLATSSRLYKRTYHCTNIVNSGVTHAMTC